MRSPLITLLKAEDFHVFIQHFCLVLLLVYSQVIGVMAATSGSYQAQPLLSYSLPSDSHPTVHLHTTTLLTLQASFDPNADLLILVASGLAGVGKSTWLNTLALSFDPQLRLDPFPTTPKVKRTGIGLKVYPRPLTLPCEEKTQVMLCELDYRDENEADKGLLRRMIFSGLVLASCFCVHLDTSQWRPGLEFISDIYELNSGIGREKPQISLLLSNTDLTANMQELKAQICSNCGLTERISASLQIYAKGLPPQSFLKSRNTKSLLGSNYHENSIRFIGNSLGYCKKRPGFDGKFRISDLPALLKHLETALNQDNYLQSYSLALKQSIEEVIQATFLRHQATFEKGKQVNEGTIDQSWALFLRKLHEDVHIDLRSLSNMHIDLQSFRERFSTLERGCEEGKEKAGQREGSLVVSDQGIREKIAELESKKGAEEQGPVVLGRLKKDGTPDKRYKSNRDPPTLHSSTSVSSSSLSSKSPSKPKSSK